MFLPGYRKKCMVCQQQEDVFVDDIDGLMPGEIKELVEDQLRDIGIDMSSIELVVSEGPRIVVKGTVDSESDRYLITRTITDIDGIENVSDELLVTDPSEWDEDEGREVMGGLFNQDDEDSITEDAFEAMEEGIPYTPPDRPFNGEASFEHDRIKKKRHRK